jgi:enoyl-CoA hydratase
MTVFRNLILETKDDIAVVQLNKPKVMNALDKGLLNELLDALDLLNQSPNIKGLIITGAGKAFVAGADISQMRSYSSEEGREYAAYAQSVFNKIEAMSKPVIAAVNGFALGGGCELALACDFIIAGEKAVFGQPEVSLGIIPCFGGTQRLSRYVGIGKAKEMIFTGNFVQSDEAEKIGLVSKVVEQEVLIDEAIDTMKKIISNAPLAIKYAKIAVNSSYDLDLKSGLELEKDLVGLCFATEDQSEGMVAFVEKRAATFKKK